MSLSFTLDVLVVVLILNRQRRTRPVPRALRLRLPFILGIIGLVQLLSYADNRHVTAGGVWLVVGTMVVGAGVLGAIRAMTVKIWETNGWVVRQGTWLTMTLWLVSLALHLTGDVEAHHVGGANLAATSFLVYLALTLGVQNYVVHLRAIPHWESLGPQAGRRLQVNFGQGAAGTGAFFAGFRNAGQGFRHSPQDDPNIIDAQVVDDDEAPPELR